MVLVCSRNVRQHQMGFAVASHPTMPERPACLLSFPSFAGPARFSVASGGQPDAPLRLCRRSWPVHHPVHNNARPRSILLAQDRALDAEVDAAEKAEATERLAAGDYLLLEAEE